MEASIEKERQPMSGITEEDCIDHKRRQFLLRATATLSVIGVAAAGIPFVASMLPSAAAEAEAAPVRISIGQMKPKDQLTVMWRGNPVWIIRRTPEEVAALSMLNDELRDPTSEVNQQPEFARNIYRSENPEFLVLVGVCTHLGCIPTYRPEPNSVEPGWPGGFFCTCHGSKFDLAGRVFKGVPAPINLAVPPYVFVNNDEILIGGSKDSLEVIDDV
jgi:ubiquinol-cytochrome c reductase iron-sulfur subunit